MVGHENPASFTGSRCETHDAGSRCGWQPGFRREGQSALQMEALRRELDQTDGTYMLRSW
jgi:hypothetical protein